MGQKISLSDWGEIMNWDLGGESFVQGIGSTKRKQSGRELRALGEKRKY